MLQLPDKESCNILAVKQFLQSDYFWEKREKLKIKKTRGKREIMTQVKCVAHQGKS